MLLRGARKGAHKNHVPAVPIKERQYFFRMRPYTPMGIDFRRAFRRYNFEFIIFNLRTSAFPRSREPNLRTASTDESNMTYRK